MIDLADRGERARLLEGLAEAARAAGAEILDVRRRGFAVERKADESPVTAADRAAEALILQRLSRIAPELPAVAEEEAAAGRAPAVGRAYFLIDPLDGTREFVRGGEDFTVNIGLILDAAPLVGVVYAPERDELYLGDAEAGVAAVRTASGETRLRVRAPRIPPTALASRSHDRPETEAYLAALGVRERVSIGSSLKFGLLARGEADLYPRPSPTMEWDTAAGHAVLLGAGGRVAGPDGRPLRYGKRDFLNPGFVATGPLEAPPIGPFMPRA